MDSAPLPPPADGKYAVLARLPWQRVVTLVLVTAGALYFLWRVRDVLPPFLIAFFLASLLDPVVTNLQKRGVSRGRAVFNIYALVFVMIALALVWIVPRAMAQMQDLVKNADTYSRNLTDFADKFYEKNKKALSWILKQKKPSDFLHEKSGLVTEATKTALDTLKRTILGFAGQVLWLIIIPLALFYFLLDYQRIRAKLIYLLPTRYQENVDRMSQEIVEIFSDYARGLAKVCALYGAAVVVLFYLLGLNYALFLGIAAGVFYAVPYVGPLLTLFAAAVVALTMGKSVGFTILMAALLISLQFSFDYGITPRIVGRSVGLHPLINIFALMCGATLFGIWGMLLAVPVAASAQMLLVYLFPKLAENPLIPSAAAPTPDSVTPTAEKEPVAG